MEQFRLAIKRSGRQRKKAQRSGKGRASERKAPRRQPTLTPSVESTPQEIGLPSTPPLKSTPVYYKLFEELPKQPQPQLPTPIPYVTRKVRIEPDAPAVLRRPHLTSSISRRQRSSVSQDAKSLPRSLKRRYPAVRRGDSFGPVLSTTSASTAPSPPSRRTSTLQLTSALQSSARTKGASETALPPLSQRPSNPGPSREKNPVMPQQIFRCNRSSKKLTIRPDGPAAKSKRSSAQAKMLEPICDAGVLSSPSEGRNERTKPPHRQRGFQVQPVSAFSTCSSATETDSPATYARHASRLRPVEMRSDGSVPSAAGERDSLVVHGSGSPGMGPDSTEPSSSSLDMAGMFLGGNGSSQQSEFNTDAPREWLWVSKEQRNSRSRRDPADGINVLRQELADMTLHSPIRPAQDPTVLRSRSDASRHASIQNLSSPSDDGPRFSPSRRSNDRAPTQQRAPSGKSHTKPLPTPPVNRSAPHQTARPSLRRLTILAEESKEGSRTSSRQSLAADEKTLVAPSGLRTPLVHSDTSSSNSSSTSLHSSPPKSAFPVSSFRTWDATRSTSSPTGPTQPLFNRPARRSFLVEAREPSCTSASDSSDTDDAESEDDAGYLASDSVVDFCPLPRKPRRRPSRPSHTRSPPPREPHAPVEVRYACRPNTSLAQRLPPHRAKPNAVKRSQQAKKEEVLQTRAAVQSRLPNVGGGASAGSVSKGIRRA